MKSYLVLFSIGPVQSFINKARKTRDLYAASRLLSDLCLEAMKKVGVENIISPQIDDTTLSVPNRFLFKIERSDDAEMTAFANQIKSKLTDSFFKIAENIFKDAKLKFNAKAQAQVKHFLEVYWVAVPTTQYYKDDYKALNKALGSVKHERTLIQNSETGRKCSIDGEFNALIYREPKPAQLDQNTGIQKYAKNDGTLNPGEALSAISFIKRRYLANTSAAEFESTATIANLDTLKNATIASELRSYKAIFGSDVDAQLLYKHNLTPNYFKKQGLEKHLEQESIPAKINDVHHALEKAIKSKNLRIEEYYAVITFDGDYAGQWLSGEFINDAHVNEDFHKKISGWLATFAQQAKAYLNPTAHNGEAVYAGGDDFLGFVNLSHLLKVMRKIELMFQQIVNQPLQEQYKGRFKEERPFTFSAGVVVAHYSEPLSQVLAVAHHLASKAKEEPNKNAYCIGIMRHSQHAEARIFTLPFSTETVPSSLDVLKNIQLLLTPKELRKHSDFSSNFIEKLHARLHKTYDDASPASFFCLIEKYVSQSYTGHKEEKETNIQAILSLLTQLQMVCQANPKTLMNVPKTFMNVLDALDFMSNHTNPPTFHATATHP